MKTVILLVLCVYVTNGINPFIIEPPRYITGTDIGESIQFNCTINTIEDYYLLYIRVDDVNILPDNDEYDGISYYHITMDTIIINITITDNTIGNSIVCVFNTISDTIYSTEGIISSLSLSLATTIAVLAIMSSLSLSLSLLTSSV